MDLSMTTATHEQHSQTGPAGGGFSPQIVAFCCHYCAYTAADMAGASRIEYPPSIRIVRLPCSGRIDAATILNAFAAGADGVFVAGCLDGDCHFIKGNTHAKRRVTEAKIRLVEVGLEAERVEMYQLSAAMGGRFAEVATEMTDRIRKLGPPGTKHEPPPAAAAQKKKPPQST
jgi:F420-non-reducing hydrogenase iron-sulfur subunit